jgi:hypothetical protein
MSKYEMKAVAPKQDLKAVAPKRWKPSFRFVDYKCRSMTIKLVDIENGFNPGEVMYTVNGPMATSQARTIKIDKLGYVPLNEQEENALLKLANKETNGSRNGSYLVTWENREMPVDQRKAELSAHEYKKRIDSLEEQVADKSELEIENKNQAQLIETLKRQLEANKGG